MNGEAPASAPFLAKFPIDSWPTLLIVDPRTERPITRWLGTVTVAQLEQMLDAAETRFHGRLHGPWEHELAAADALAGAGQFAAAAAAYEKLLARAPADALDRPHVIEARVGALAEAGDWPACAQAAKAAWDMPPGHARSDVFGTGLYCALEETSSMPPHPDPPPPGGGGNGGSPPYGGGGNAGDLEALFALAQAELGDGAQLDDDRSGLYEVALKAADALGQKREAATLAKRWFAFLQRQAALAPSAEARTALDGHRVEAARALGDVAAALPALLRSERELPDDFNPPARLAVVYGELGRFREALAASERALGLAQGPRRLRLLRERAEIDGKMGDRLAREKALRQALAIANALPAAQRPAGEVATIQKLLSQR